MKTNQKSESSKELTNPSVEAEKNHQVVDRDRSKWNAKGKR